MTVFRILFVAHSHHADVNNILECPVYQTCFWFVWDVTFSFFACLLERTPCLVLSYLLLLILAGFCFVSSFIFFLFISPFLHLARCFKKSISMVFDLFDYYGDPTLSQLGGAGATLATVL